MYKSIASLKIDIDKIPLFKSEQSGNVNCVSDLPTTQYMETQITENDRPSSIEMKCGCQRSNLDRY